VSEVSQGPGWWLASDGRWYSPEQAPGYADPTPRIAPDQGGPSFPPGFGPSGSPSAAGPTYAPPFAPGYPPPMDPGHGYPGGGSLYGYVPVKRTNGLAIASLVCSLVWLGGLGSILAVIFGFIARSQIKKSEGGVQGNGLAIAGIIVGLAGVVILVLLVIVIVAVVHHCDQTGNCTTNTNDFGN